MGGSGIVVDSIEDFLILDIDDDQQVLDVIHGKTPLIRVMDIMKVLQYVKKWNEFYCKEFDLCPNCLAELDSLEKVCPNGCD